MDNEVSNESISEIERFESIAEAYEAGKRAGMIEGYLRATESLKTTIDRLQAMFVKKISGAKEQPENE
jgi:hypothetical protein